MTKTFTQNDLIRYLYKETSETETREINKALICDSDLQQQFKELLSAKSQLDGALLQPSESAVDNILHYAHGVQENH